MVQTVFNWTIKLLSNDSCFVFLLFYFFSVSEL